MGVTTERHTFAYKKGWKPPAHPWVFVKSKDKKAGAGKKKPAAAQTQSAPKNTGGTGAVGGIGPVGGVAKSPAPATTEKTAPAPAPAAKTPADTVPAVEKPIPKAAGTEDKGGDSNPAGKTGLLKP